MAIQKLTGLYQKLRLDYSTELSASSLHRENGFHLEILGMLGGRGAGLAEGTYTGLVTLSLVLGQFHNVYHC